jgi:hypothetical protein
MQLFPRAGIYHRPTVSVQLDTYWAITVPFPLAACRSEIESFDKSKHSKFEVRLLTTYQPVDSQARRVWGTSL